MKRMACAIALAAGTGMTGLAALPAFATSSPATAAAGLQANSDSVDRPDRRSPRLRQAAHLAGLAAG